MVDVNLLMNLYAGVSVANSNPNATKNKISMVVLSGDMDKVMAAFLIGTGAAASGMEVTMFFTFWGFKAIQKKWYKTGHDNDGKNARHDEPGRSGCNWTQPAEHGGNGTLDVQKDDERKGRGIAGRTLPDSG